MLVLLRKPWTILALLALVAGNNSAETGHARPWNGVNVTNSRSETNCRWKEVQFRTVTYFQCIRPYKDTISQHIWRHGIWPDCVQLVDTWPNIRQPRSQRFLDAGANIGSCTLLMAAVYPNIRILAFEPSPSNLFYFTRSLERNPSINKRVTLYPVGLSDTFTSHRLYEQPGNAGNSVMDAQVKWSSAHPLYRDVHVVRLDSILWSAAQQRVRLMKMDVQGFEVKLLNGMGELLPGHAVGCVQFEAAPIFLKNQNTTATELVGIFNKHGYNTTVGKEAVDMMACVPKYSSAGDLSK